MPSTSINLMILYNVDILENRQMYSERELNKSLGGNRIQKFFDRILAKYYEFVEVCR